MAFPHPKSSKNKYRNGDKPNHGGVVWKFFKRTINITDYRNAKDDVNPAKNRTFGGIIHDWCLFIGGAEAVTLPQCVKRWSPGQGRVGKVLQGQPLSNQV
jgi:hypothetical protein